MSPYFRDFYDVSDGAGGGKLAFLEARNRILIASLPNYSKPFSPSLGTGTHVVLGISAWVAC